MAEFVLDFEASGLDPVHSYPIQVAWSMTDGTVESHYIIPEEDWTYWDSAAETEVHGISRQKLISEGKPANWVAQRMNFCLRGQTVYWDGGDWDAFWLRRLFEYSVEEIAFYQGDFSRFAPEVPNDVRARLSALAFQASGPAHDAANDVRFLLLYREYATQYVNGKRIATEQEYDETLKQIESIWNADKGTKEGELLDKLVDLVEAYEDIYHHIGDSRVMHREIPTGPPVGREFGGPDCDYD